jgi:hypothetical protein
MPAIRPIENEPGVRRGATAAARALSSCVIPATSIQF